MRKGGCLCLNLVFLLFSVSLYLRSLCSAGVQLSQERCLLVSGICLLSEDALVCEVVLVVLCFSE